MNALHAVGCDLTSHLCCYAKTIPVPRKPVNEQRVKRLPVLVSCQLRDARREVDRIVVEDDPRYRRYPSNKQGVTYKQSHAFTCQDSMHAKVDV